ncbi:MAG TPA: hypothetical protein VFF47_00645 [Nitrospirota bacterium]|nr:hypothetical protein [Nitrospirota bacterium]
MNMTMTPTEIALSILLVTGVIGIIWLLISERRNKYHKNKK